MDAARSPELGAFVEGVRIGTRLIDPPYVCVPQHSLAEQKYRERIYCYELYHQLRCCTREDVWRVLPGSTSKITVQFLKRLLNRAMPDFLFHLLGETGTNVVVMSI